MSNYLRVQLDAVNLCVPVAQLCEERPQVIGGGLIMLWTYCKRSLKSSVTNDELKAHMGSDCGEALAVFGFVRKLDDGNWHVCGSEEWLGLSESRKKGGLAAKNNLKQYQKSAGAQPDVSRTPAGESGPAQTGSTPIHLETYIKEKKYTKKERVTDSKPDPRHQPTLEALTATWQTRRGCKYPTVDIGHDVKALSSLLNSDKELQTQAIVLAFERALASTHPVIGSIRDFVRNFGKFTGNPPAASPAGRPAQPYKPPTRVLKPGEDPYAV